MIRTYPKEKSFKIAANFKTREFDCKCGKAGCKYTLLDDKLVSYLQKMRNHFKKPIIINSGYRCFSHNKAVGGAVNSRHTRGQAADIVVKGVSSRKVAAYAETLGINGIGLYDTFTHIDTRTYKYYWYSSKQVKKTTFK